MGTEPIQDAVCDEAFRKIGRNVVLFQQLEGVLKFLARAQHPTMPLSKAQAKHAERAASLQVQSLGQIAGRVIEALHADPAAEDPTPTEISEPWFGFSFRIGADAVSVDESRKRLKALIDERNNLVHHLLSHWNLLDSESCRALSFALDEQRGRIVSEIELYQTYAKSLREMASVLQAFIDSDEWKRQFDLAFLQQSRVVAVLMSVAKEHARADGWTPISTAGNHLSQMIPEEFTRMKGEHGALRNLIVAAELFDVRTEQLANGGARAVYRLRSVNDA